MLSFTKPDSFYQVLLTQGLGVGLGVGMTCVPSLAIISHYFHKRRALAMAIVAAGGPVGSVLHPVMLNNTLNGLGFAGATRANAGLMTGLLLISCMIMRPRLPFVTHQPDLSKLIFKFMKDGPYIVAVAGFALFYLAYWYPIFYLQLDATKHGLSNQFSFYSMVILSVASLVGRLSSGFLASPIGVELLVIVSAGCCVIIMFSMIAIKTVASVVIFAVLYGYFSGIFVGLTAPLLAILADELHELGIRIGVCFAICASFNMIGPPINGALLTLELVWWKPAVFSALMMAAGFSFLILMLLLLQRKRRQEIATICGEIVTTSSTPACKSESMLQ